MMRAYSFIINIIRYCIGVIFACINSIKYAIGNKRANSGGISETGFEADVYKSALLKEHADCIVLNRGLGDFILFAPYLEKLCDSYCNSNKNLFIICNESSSCFFDLTDTKNAKTVLISKDDEKDLEKLMDIKKSYEIDLLILPSANIRWIFSDLTDILEPARVICEGRELENLKSLRLGSFKALSKAIVCSDDSLRFYSYLHRDLTAQVIGKELDAVCLSLKAPGITALPGFSYYAVCISASAISHTVPVSEMLDLIKAVSKDTGLKAVLIGQASAETLEYLKAQGISTEYLNNYDIKRETDIIANAELVITMDSGIYHLAAALHKPSVVFMHGSSHVRFVPYPKEFLSSEVRYIPAKKSCYKCPMHIICHFKKDAHRQCMTNIDIDNIAGVVKELYRKD